MITIPDKLNAKYSYAVQKRKFHFVEYTSANEICGNEVFATENAIVYIVQGRKVITADGVTCEVSQGELFMLPKGKYLMSEYLPDNGEFRSIMLFFNHHHIADVFSTVNEKSTTPRKLRNIKSVQIIKSTKRLSLFFESLITIDWENNDAYGKVLLGIKIKELIIILLSDKSTKEQTLSFLESIYASTNRSLSAVVNENIFNKISIETLSKMCNMSVSTFKREFAKEFKSSPVGWINNKRLEKSMMLIQNTSTSITDIAYECGFENYVHFSRRFKAKYGKPANNFRT